MEEVLYERVASVDSSPPWLPAVSRDCRVYTPGTLLEGYKPIR
jgi:hypothetical protein